TPEQIDRFREDGFLIIDGFFTQREASALLAELTRIIEERRASGSLRNVAVQEDGSENNHDGERLNLQVIPLNDKSPLYKALPFAPKVADTVAQLIGDSYRLHLDQAFWKPAKKGMGTHWHQDNAYFKIADPLKGTAMWVAMHDATVENGTLHVIPGSHREPYEHYRDPFSDHHIRCDPPEERAVPVELKAGGVIFFCYGVAHCTLDNKSDGDRAGIALHFIHTDCAQGDSWTKYPERTPIVRGPDASGGLKENGVKIEGTWELQVDAALAGSHPMKARQA
ncbi:MAG: phytanoyl-CoA dioxygenase family protein, partial [Candidatus Poribacteria bacterium]|nr:phytanoyl-CoA dioxygenase family protein [Candidatus Poribacteria bacterium]